MSLFLLVPVQFLFDGALLLVLDPTLFDPALIGLSLNLVHRVVTL